MVETGGLDCAAGDSGDCFTVGRAYFAGDGVTPDRDRGIGFIQKACALGEKAACDWQVTNRPAMTE